MTDQLAREVLARLQSRQAEIEKFIHALVEVESPSGDDAGSRTVVDLLVQAADALDCVNAIERVDVPHFGQHVAIKAFQGHSAAAQILLVGHTDTVHARGALSDRPWRREAGKIYGPGIFDMKANCALAIEVLRALSELQVTPQFGVTLALTCDEEVGSMSGWPFLRELASNN